MALSSAGTLGQVCSLQIKLIISILLEKRDIDISIILGSLYRVFQGEIWTCGAWPGCLEWRWGAEDASWQRAGCTHHQTHHKTQTWDQSLNWIKQVGRRICWLAWLTKVFNECAFAADHSQTGILRSHQTYWNWNSFIELLHSFTKYISFEFFPYQYL